MKTLTYAWRFLARSKAYTIINILGLLEKPRDFDPFGQTGFAHLWLQYD